MARGPFDVKDVGTPELLSFRFCCCCKSGLVVLFFISSVGWLASIVLLVVASVVDILASRSATVCLFDTADVVVVNLAEGLGETSPFPSSSWSSSSSSGSWASHEWAILLCWTGSNAMPIIKELSRFLLDSPSHFNFKAPLTEMVRLAVPRAFEQWHV